MCHLTMPTNRAWTIGYDTRLLPHRHVPIASARRLNHKTGASMSAEDNTAVARVDHDLDAAVCLCHPIAFALFEGFGEAHSYWSDSNASARALLVAVPDSVFELDPVAARSRRSTPAPRDALHIATRWASRDAKGYRRSLGSANAGD